MSVIGTADDIRETVANTYFGDIKYKKLVKLVEDKNTHQVTISIYGIFKRHSELSVEEMVNIVDHIPNALKTTVMRVSKFSWWMKLWWIRTI